MEAMTIHDSTLQELLLDWNKFTSRSGTVSVPTRECASRCIEIDDSAAIVTLVSTQAIGNMLTCSRHLLKLRLDGNRLCDEGGQAIARSFGSNSTIRELDLARTEIGGKTAFIASKLLKGHESMKVRHPPKRCNATTATH